MNNENIILIVVIILFTLLFIFTLRFKETLVIGLTDKKDIINTIMKQINDSKVDTKNTPNPVIY